MSSVVFNNISWMAYNISLAVIPVLLGWTGYYLKNRILKLVTLFAWILFVPNTIYMLTDLIHLIEQLGDYNFTTDLFLLFEYFLLFLISFLTFIFSLYPIERIIKKDRHLKKIANVNFYLIIINFSIGFAIVLGRVNRLNSWDVIFDKKNVYVSVISALNSPDMIGLTILFGLLANFLYFLFKQNIIKIFYQTGKK